MTETDELVKPSPGRAPTARAPLSAADASFLAVLLALIVIGIGVVGLHDGIVATGWVDRGLWTPVAADWLAAQRPGAWMIPVGVVLAVVGLGCVLAAITPRRKPAAQVTANTAVFLDLTDTARIASATAESVPGVVSARSTARRGAVVVRCAVTGPLTSEQRHAVETAVGAELAALRATPKVVVRTRTVTAR